MLLNNGVKDFKKKLIDTPFREYLKGVVYVFHHIPKCGGISVRDKLYDWFYVCYDYEPDFAYDTPEQEHYRTHPWNLNKLRPYNCVAGHYDEPHLITTRYPEVFSDKRYRVFSFVREPYRLTVSLYYFWQKYRPQNLKRGETLVDFIKTSENRIADYYGYLNEDNYQEYLSNYFFLGVTEQLQESMDVLSKKIGRKRIEVPTLNATKKNNELDAVPKEVVVDFIARNKLDYLIYHYALKRFEEDSKQYLT